MTPTVPPPEQVAAVRRRYAEGDPVAAIQSATGINSVGVLYRCLDGRYDDGSGAELPLPAIPRRHSGLRIVRSPSRRKALVARIWRNAEAQVEQIETRLASSGLGTEDFERDARTLAVVVRTLRELKALDAAKRTEQSAAGEAQKKTAANDKPVPRNIDDLRRELARRLQALVEQEPGKQGGKDLEPAGRAV